MDDIFYLTDRKITITDIAEIARETNAVNVFIPLSADVMQIEYEKNITSDWSCMKTEDFSEAEDKIFLVMKFYSIFCIKRDFLKSFFCRKNFCENY